MSDDAPPGLPVRMHVTRDIPWHFRPRRWCKECRKITPTRFWSEEHHAYLYACRWCALRKHPMSGALTLCVDGVEGALTTCATSGALTQDHTTKETTP